MKAILRNFLVGIAVAMVAQSSFGEGGKKIAVTDLSFEERIAGYFHSYEFKGRANSTASTTSGSSSSPSSFNDKNTAYTRENADVHVKSSSGYQLFIDRGELRKFTADIKGGLIRSGNTVVQGRPWTQSNTEGLFDIVNRIKAGHFTGADYVLWGTISNVDFRQDDMPVVGSNAISHTLSLGLTVEFSLIDTKRRTVIASFSAMGEGSDTKLTSSSGGRVSLNRAKVVFEASRTLGEAVARELSYDQENSAAIPGNRTGAQADERVVVFK